MPYGGHYRFTVTSNPQMRSSATCTARTMFLPVWIALGCSISTAKGNGEDARAWTDIDAPGAFAQFPGVSSQSHISWLKA